MSIGLGACTTELCPDSLYLLRVGPPTGRGGVRYHAIWSLADAMVVPPMTVTLGRIMPGWITPGA